jgi:CDP-glycerol glycerophosphotransferase
MLMSYGIRSVFNATTLLPIKKNTVVFESFFGKSFRDNPKAIFDYMFQHPGAIKEEDLYISAHRNIYEDIKKEYPDANVLMRFSPKWIGVMARANFWVINVRLPKWLHKNKGTTYIETWHGTPLKKLGIDIVNVAMPDTDTKQYHDNFVNEAARWDYLVAPNQYSAEIFKSAFGFVNTMLNTGYPRNDVLTLKNNETDIARLKEKYLGHTNGKVVLYAPTWRDDQFFDKGRYKFQMPFDLGKILEQLNPEDTFIIRPHYLIKDAIDIKGYEERVKIMADEDISDLYLISDLLITDYSSVFFDYAILKRPMMFYAYDLEHYREDLRGFYFDYEAELPGPIVEKEEDFYLELGRFTKEGGFSEQTAKYAAFNEKFTSWENGTASKQIADLMNQQVKS